MLGVANKVKNKVETQNIINPKGSGIFARAFFKKELNKNKIAMVYKAGKKNGASQDWIKTDPIKVNKEEAEKKLQEAKKQEIGKQYIRVPHPTLKNTFILKEKE